MANAKEQARIVCLQKQVKFARDALTRISAGNKFYIGLALDAIDEMNRLEWASRPTPLQGLVGHEKRN